MEKKTLVTYFSATGTTKEIAITLAKMVGADLYEIEPQEPYTDSDLDWNDRNSRCVKEWKDKSCRPKIKTALPDINLYDTIWIGYPTAISCQEGWHRPVLCLFAKNFGIFSCNLPKVACFQS